MKATTTPTTPRLRSSDWAMSLYGYTSAQRSAFWQFAKLNKLPFIRVGKRKIMFSEAAILRDLERRSVGGRTDS